jgi:Mg2+/Co2+ transporter CorC
MPIDDLGELFDEEIEEDDVDSVGGLVAKALGRLPEVGSTVAVHGLRFTVDRVEGRRRHVSTVLVERDPALIPAPDVAPERERGRDKDRDRDRDRDHHRQHQEERP